MDRVLEKQWAHGMVLVGVSGYARAGKDTIGHLLMDAHGFQRYAFADQLKRCLYALNPVVGTNQTTGAAVRLKGLLDSTPGSWEGKWEKMKQLVEVRTLLQRLGTEVGREILGEDIWVETCLKQISESPLPPDKTAPVRIIVTDMRFPNEAKALKREGGYLIRVNRVMTGPARDAKGHVHRSEVALDEWSEWDFIVDNDGTISDLVPKIAMIANELQPTNW